MGAWVLGNGAQRVEPPHSLFEVKISRKGIFPPKFIMEGTERTIVRVREDQSMTKGPARLQMVFIGVFSENRARRLREYRHEIRTNHSDVDVDLEIITFADIGLGKLQVSLKDHRLLEAKMGKYPKQHNELHSKGEISETLRALEALGLVFEVRDNDGIDFVVIPEEVAQVMKEILSIEIRRPAFEVLLQHKLVRKKNYLLDMLQKANIPHSRTATLAELQQRVLESLPPSILIGGTSPRDGLNNEDLAAWCAELEIPMTGTKQERIGRIVRHYDQLDLRPREEGDGRELWYHYFAEFANRDRETLRIPI